MSVVTATNSSNATTTGSPADNTTTTGTPTGNTTMTPTTTGGNTTVTATTTATATGNGTTTQATTTQAVVTAATTSTPKSSTSVNNTAGGSTTKEKEKEADHDDHVEDHVEMSKAQTDAIMKTRNETASSEQPEAVMHRLSGLPAPAGAAGNSSATNSSRRLTAEECTKNYRTGLKNSFRNSWITSSTPDNLASTMGVELYSCKVSGGAATASFIQFLKPGTVASSVPPMPNTFEKAFKTEMIANKVLLGVTEASINAATPAVVVAILPVDVVTAIFTAAGGATGAKVDLTIGTTLAECQGGTKAVADQSLGDCHDVGVEKVKAWTCIYGAAARGNADATCPSVGRFLEEGVCQRISDRLFLKVSCGSTNSMAELLKGSDVLTQLDTIADTGSDGSSTTSGAYSTGLGAFASVAMVVAYVM